MTTLRTSIVALACLALAACQGSTPNPAAPGTAGTGGVVGANADGSTLKASIPAAVSPIGRAVVESLRPDLVFTNATARFRTATFTYRVELYRENVKLTEIVARRAPEARRRLPFPQTSSTKRFIAGASGRKRRTASGRGRRPQTSSPRPARARRPGRV